MGLTFLAPLAAILALMVGLPIVAHLSRQTPRERHAFGAMLLIERMVKRLRRKRRVKDLPLLLLRALVVLLLAVAAMAPQFTFPGALPEFGGSGRVVIVLDRSLSMSLQDGGSTLLQRAREQAMSVVDGLPSGALVGVVVFDDDADRLTASLTTDHARARARLAELQPTSGRSNLRAALVDARRLLGGESGEVLVFTDEAGPLIVEQASEEIAALITTGSSVIPRVVRAEPARNVAVVDAGYQDGVEGGQVTVRIANFGLESVEVACEVRLPDGQVISIFADVPPQGEAEERITVPSEVSGGVGQAWCDDPDLPLDDARYFHLPRVGASRVLVVDGDPGDTPTRSEVYFLERALSPWGGSRSGVTLDVTTPASLAHPDPDTHRVVILANVADPRPFGLALTEFVRQGGNLIITAGSNITAERYNAAFGGILPAPFRRPRSVADAGEEGVALKLPDAEASLFKSFSRGGRRGFGRIKAHTLLTVDPYEDVEDEVTTWLAFENDMPALLERRIGAGRVMVWTSSVDLGWGNLPLQAVFMPMMQRVVGWLGAESGGNALRLNSIVGEPVAVPLPDLTIDPDVTGPDGGAVRSRLEGSTLRFQPKRPGAYRVAVADAPPMAWVAVNTDPEESRVQPVDSIVGLERELAPELLERRIDLGRGVFAFALVLLLLQGILALRGGSA